jgi:hypothetical protein
MSLPDLGLERKFFGLWMNNKIGFVHIADLKEPSQNARFWNTLKLPRFTLPQTPFQNQAVVERFSL